jgi:glyoxylase-like metal-dependent hydrolase (beta-lactamase superfamily II)
MYLRLAACLAALCAAAPTLCLTTPARQPAAARAIQNAAPPSPYRFEIERIADGVYVARRAEHAGLMFNANAVFVVSDDEVVVVDTTITPSSAKELLAAIAKLTTKPVRFVVNTHFHDDHVMGNAVFRDAYPGATFVAHEYTRVDMTTDGVTNRKQLVEGAPAILDRMRELMTEKKSLGGWPLTDEERASYLSDIAQVDRYLAEAPSFEIVLPTVTFEERLTLHAGNRTVELRHLGAGHSRGDTVVWLPDDAIAIVGDLVSLPVPLAGLKSSIAEWPETLDRLLALHPKTIVPGHGPVLHDDAYVRLTRDLMRSIWTQTSGAAARGESVEAARKALAIGEIRSRFANESKLLGFLFDSYVVGPAVAAAHREALERRAAS